MVCFVNETAELANNLDRNDVIDLNMDDYGRNEWRCQRIAGGSVIEHPPIFSPSGE